jgi:hypothetical protein
MENRLNNVRHIFMLHLYLNLVSVRPSSRLLLQLDLQPPNGRLVLLDPLTEQAGALLGCLSQLISCGHALLLLALEG